MRLRSTTQLERRASYWCDAVLEDANTAVVHSIDVSAPPRLLFRWLCQLRVAAYSYEWADLDGRRSPGYLIPDLDRLELGQSVLGLFQVVHFVPGREVTIVLERGRMEEVGLSGWYVPAAITYRVSEGASPRSSRLVVKSVGSYPGGFRWMLLRRLVRRSDALLLRRQLATLKKLAERDAAQPARLPRGDERAAPARRRETVAG